MIIRAQRLLDSPATTRVIQLVAVLSLILAIGIGFKQLNLASCLSSYSNASAVSTAGRAAAAAEDRKADEADRQADAQEREAFRVLIAALASQDQVKTQAAFASLVATYQETDKSRAATALARAENERKRRANPVPPSPELKCG
jgi:hypothetical protein